MLRSCRWMRNKRMVPTADHNTLPTCLESLRCSWPYQRMQKLILTSFLSGILTLKTVLQSAPEHAIMAPRVLDPRTFGTQHLPSPPLHKILNMPLDIHTNKNNKTFLAPRWRAKSDPTKLGMAIEDLKHVIVPLKRSVV